MPEQVPYKKIKLFANKSSLPAGTPHTILLYPFLGNITIDSIDPDQERFDDYIDWKKYMVWIDEKEIKSIAQQLKDFHAALTENQFNELKNNCRKLYEEYISPVVFFHLYTVMFRR
ncbi:MAG: hypothetical protein H0W84_02195 [Bacteroidetes bacterium]|nr:hypothetical protein [Bacteroidota bacterium]